MSKFSDKLLQIKPSKRKLIQLYSALLYNANMKGFIKGNIYTGKSKSVCVPGMNCYSCPGAVGACPLGSLQNALSESKTKAPTYVLGIILLYCIIFGRTICGWICPAGWLQELLYKIKTPKLRKNRVTRVLSYFKYVLLLVLAIWIPIIYGITSGKSIPGFCKYICPVGTFEGAISLLSNKNNSSYFEMLGPLFTWKFALLIGFIVAGIFIYRFFCRFFCPLGALYGLFNKLSILGIKVDKDKCNSCGACVSHCKMDIKEVGDHECIMCGECKATCNQNAIEWKVIDSIIKKKKNEEITEKVDSKQVNKKKIIDYVVTAVLMVLLVVEMIVVNVDFNKSMKINIGDTTSIKIDTYNNNGFDFTNNSKVTLIYFYDHYSEADMNKFISLKDSSYTLIAVSSYSNREVNKNLVPSDSDVIFAYDNKNNDAIRTFSEDAKYPFYVWTDSSNSLKYASDSIYSETEIATIKQIASGLGNVGNKVGDICLSQNITLRDKDGNESIFNINDYRGKVIVLNFWATWCGPCVQELPYFDEISKKYSDDVIVVACHDGESYDETGYMKFIKKSQYSEYTINFGYDNITSQYFKDLGGADTLPMTVIIDQNGVIIYNSPSSVTVELLERELAKVLSN